MSGDDLMITGLNCCVAETKAFISTPYTFIVRLTMQGYGVLINAFVSAAQQIKNKNNLKT